MKRKRLLPHIIYIYWGSTLYYTDLLSYHVHNVTCGGNVQNLHDRVVETVVGCEEVQVPSVMLRCVASRRDEMK